MGRGFFSQSAAKGQRGAAIVEVGLLIALIAVIGIVSIKAVGLQVFKGVAPAYEIMASAGSIYNHQVYCSMFGHPTDPICTH